MKKICVIGAGGHAKVVVASLRACARNVGVAVGAGSEEAGGKILGLPVVDEAAFLSAWNPTSCELAFGIGSIGSGDKREAIFNRFKALGYAFATIVHPSAVVDPSARLGEGTQVMAGAVIQVDAVVGVNCIVNTGACVDHDCVVGSHVHVAPGAVLSGSVHVGDRALIGCGATILQGMTIGADAVVGAGAVVVDGVAAGKTVVGVPARERSK